MGWTAPHTWVVNEVLTAAQANTYIRDNTQYNLDTVRAASIHYDAMPNWNGHTGAAPNSGIANGTTQIVGVNGTTPLQVAFTKRYAETQLLFITSMSGYQNFASGASQFQEFMAIVGGASFTIGNIYLATNAEHRTLARSVMSSGAIAAGAYTVARTIQGQAPATATWTFDANDSMDLTVLEVNTVN